MARRKSRLMRVDEGFAQTLNEIKAEEQVGCVRITKEIDRMLKRKEKRKQLRGFRFKI